MFMHRTQGQSVYYIYNEDGNINSYFSSNTNPNLIKSSMRKCFFIIVSLFQRLFVLSQFPINTRSLCLKNDFNCHAR